MYTFTYAHDTPKGVVASFLAHAYKRLPAALRICFVIELNG